MQVKRKGNRQRHDRRGFTLLEVLLVLIILGVIAALVVPNLLGTQERANINAARASISRLEGVIELYAVEHNARYPETLDDLLQPVDLQGQPMKPYLNEYPKDPWGQRLNYELTTDSNAAGAQRPRIWSNGPDGKNDNGSGDDINNWSQAESEQR